ncbi:hypothetical protein AAG906_017891 [Vitis piasezkii]
MELPPGFDEERTNGKNGKITILIVYVDDIILTGDDVIDMERLKQKLATEFEMKDLGSLRYFLGIEVARNKIGISVSQRKYVLDLLGETGLVGCKPVETLVDSNVKIDTQKVNNPVDSGRYQHLVGKLIYLSYTRPDIAFAVSWVSQIMHAPAEEHMVAVYRILKYLKGHLARSFLWENGEGSIEAYIDVDWAGAIDDRKSTSDIVLCLGNLVTWRSKKQAVIARSIAKVELRSVAHGICELEVMVKLPLRIYCDNKAAINISHNQFIIIGRSMLKLIGISSSKKLRMVAAWDANLVTPHKRMGNAAISLECLCDGNLHEVLLELEGMGGGGKIQLEVKYKSFKEIDEEKNWWKVPFVSEFLRKNGFESAMKMVLGSETVQARQFVQHAFGQLSLSNDAYLQKNQFSNIDKYERESTESKSSVLVSDTPPQLESSLDGSLNDTSSMDGSNLQDFGSNNAGKDNGNVLSVVPQIGDRMQSDKYFWNNFGDLINQSVVQKLGFPAPEKINWDGFDLLKGIGLQSRRIAEATYIESGLATPKSQDVVDDGDDTTGPLNFSTIQSSLPDIRKATQDIMSQTDSILGALMVLTAAVSQLNKEGRLSGKDETKENDSNKKEDDVSEYFRIEKFSGSQEGSVVDERKAEEMKALFSTAETAMEAWAMLATSLGHPSFIKSEFEKICFLDNPSTDTQVAIWRDSARRRLVVAFRGTEQARWKDLRTDLMLVPAGLNPERIGGDFKQEIQWFLSAYDSVRTRIISLIKLLVGYIDDGREMQLKWHVYVTGHSLGGALATLLALELSSSQLAKRGVISVTMYNFGSPRVGNKRFAEVYNEVIESP